MAYQARRKALYTEAFELAEEDGTVIHTLQVSLDPDSMAANLSRKHLALTRALQAVNASDVEGNPAEALETAGNAVRDIVEAVFGEDGAKTILDFYDGRYIEIAREVLPFVTDCVIPAVRQMAQENKAEAVAGYSRKKPRLFGRA